VPWPSWVRVVAALALLYAAYAALVFVFQRDLIYAGRRRGAPPESPPLPDGLQRLWLTPPGLGGSRVEAYHWPSPASPQGAREPAPALLFAHGNAELIDHWPSLLAAARSLGVSATIVEYPGYGRSGGAPSEQSIAAAMVAAHDWLAAQPHVDASRIVAYGRSLGGGAACALARSRPLAALILQSSFTGLAPFARGVFVPPLLLRDRFDNAGVLASFDGPVLLMHGERDDIIPYAHGQALARAASRATLRTYRCAHNDCPPDLDAWLDDLRAFLQQHGILPARNAAE
jgi:fermentation-respiration switch protein FrsA (DUF1100 family)